jgi:4-amino-4-deoxy-L-arabinose transferase-like glycosyltransferase
MTVRLSARFFSILFVALLSTLGMALVLRATPEGLILSDDSIAYIAGARSILAGQGYREAWLASNGPVTHFPPAYPGMLAFLGWFGLDPVRGARLLAAVLFGLNAVLLGILGWRMTRWLPAGILLSLMFVLNDSLLRLHASALSEPLFIFLTLLSFWMFDLYHERDSHWLWLVACGTLVGAAYLTRYAALALAATIVIAVLLLNSNWRRRLVSLGIFATSLVPWIAGWAYRNYIIAGTTTNRVLAWHPITQSNLDIAWRTLAGFLLPVESWRQAAFRSQWLLPVVVLVISLGLVAWLFTGWRVLRGSADVKRHDVLSLLNGMYAIGYVASILAAMFLFDASTKFKLRILAPAFVSLLIVLVAVAASAWTRRRALVIVLGAVIVAMSAYGLAGTMNELMKGGQGYASFRWYDSNAMTYLSLLPDEVAIYTNEPGAVYLHTDRPAYVLPDRVDPVTAAQRPGFDRGRRELQLEVQSGRAVLALFSGGDLPADDGAALSDGLYLLHKSGGTEIYGARP